MHMSQITRNTLVCLTSALWLCAGAAQSAEIFEDCLALQPTAPLRSSEIVVPGQPVPARSISAAQRALPSLTGNVLQRAHYQHVYIDALEPNAGSLQTVTLEDAVRSGVLASSPLQALPLAQIDATALRWVVLESGFPRPKELEGVGGADVRQQSFAEVHFALNEAEILNRSSIEPLLKLASRVEGVFHVVGFTDETGEEEGNQELSERRAQAVGDSLVAAGVNPSRVTLKGAGVSRTYATHAENRRASISFRIVK